MLASGRSYENICCVVGFGRSAGGTVCRKRQGNRSREVERPWSSGLLPGSLSGGGVAIAVVRWRRQQRSEPIRVQVAAPGRRSRSPESSSGSPARTSTPCGDPLLCEQEVTRRSNAQCVGLHRSAGPDLYLVPGTGPRQAQRRLAAAPCGRCLRKVLMGVPLAGPARAVAGLRRCAHGRAPRDLSNATASNPRRVEASSVAAEVVRLAGDEGDPAEMTTVREQVAELRRHSRQTDRLCPRQGVGPSWRPGSCSCRGIDYRGSLRNAIERCRIATTRTVSSPSAS